MNLKNLLLIFRSNIDTSMYSNPGNIWLLRIRKYVYNIRIYVYIQVNYIFKLFFKNIYNKKILIYLNYFFIMKFYISVYISYRLMNILILLININLFFKRDKISLIIKWLKIKN